MILINALLLALAVSANSSEPLGADLGEAPRKPHDTIGTATVGHLAVRHSEVAPVTSAESLRSLTFCLNDELLASVQLEDEAITYRENVDLSHVGPNSQDHAMSRFSAMVGHDQIPASGALLDYETEDRKLAPGVSLLLDEATKGNEERDVGEENGDEGLGVHGERALGFNRGRPCSERRLDIKLIACVLLGVLAGAAAAKARMAHDDPVARLVGGMVALATISGIVWLAFGAG